MSENSFVVSSDDVMMGRDAVLHLAEKGCRRIAFIGLGKMKAPFKGAFFLAFRYCFPLSGERARKFLTTQKACKANR